jgi:hypothetical protein
VAVGRRFGRSFGFCVLGCTFHLQLAHSEELEHAVLHILQAVVILVQDPLGVVEYDLVFGAHAPGQLDHVVEVGANHLVLGRLRVGTLQPVQLAIDFRTYIVRQLQLRDTLLQLFQIAGLILIAQLALNRFHLFAQHHLALTLAQLLLHLLLDLLLRIYTQQITLDAHQHAPHPLFQRRQLEQRLLVLRRDIQVEGDQVRKGGRAVHALDDLTQRFRAHATTLTQLGGTIPQLAVECDIRGVERIGRLVFLDDPGLDLQHRLTRPLV